MNAALTLILLVAPGQSTDPVIAAADRCIEKIDRLIEQTSYAWKKTPNLQYALYYKGRQVGVYNPSRDRYRPLYRDGALGEPCQPPVQLPELNFGIKKVEGSGDQLPGTQSTFTPAYSINGQPVTRDEAMAHIEDKLPDDAKLLRLTVIGGQEQRDRVVKDLESAPELAVWKDKLVVQDYDPGHWAVSATGFKTDGSPTIYLQAPPGIYNIGGQPNPGGEVLLRCDNYDGGAPLLAHKLHQSVQAVRKRQPDYRPDQDPDGKPPRIPVPTLPDVPPAPVALYGLGGLLAILFGFGKRQPAVA